MGITLTTEQQKFFDAFNNMDKSDNSNELDVAYANFLKVLRDVNPTRIHRGLIYVNRYLNPEYFQSADYKENDLDILYAILEDYITTTDQETRNTRHQQLLLCLQNETISNLFLRSPLRTMEYFTPFEYIKGVSIDESYIQNARDSVNIGSMAFEDTFIQPTQP
jgi:hypothetical protein